MRIRSLIIAVISASAITASAAIHGAWTATTWDEKPGFVQLNMARRNSNWGRTTDLATLSGLSALQVNARASTAVAFEMRRDAGVIRFEGSFKDGDGAGQFDFTPNAAYLDALRSLRVDVKSEKGDEESLFRLAMHDVSSAFIRDMQALGYRGPIDMYIRFRIHDVNPELVRQFASLGLRDLDAQDLVRSRIHDATPEFIRAMRDRGYGGLSMDDYVRFRIHGVTPEFVEVLRSLGYERIDAQELVRMCIHGVTPEYIRDLESAGYHGIPVDKLIQMRIHGIDADFARKANGH